MTRAQSKDQLSKMVDELGDLEEQVASARPGIARCEVLRAAIRAAVKDSDPTRTQTFAGEKWSVIVGAAGNMSVVDKAELLRLVGQKKYSEAASISLAALKERFGDDVVGAVVTTEQIGPRPLTLQPMS